MQESITQLLTKTGFIDLFIQHDYSVEFKGNRTYWFKKRKHYFAFAFPSDTREMLYIDTNIIGRFGNVLEGYNREVLVKDLGIAVEVYKKFLPVIDTLKGFENEKEVADKVLMKMKELGHKPIYIGSKEIIVYNPNAKVDFLKKRQCIVDIIEYDFNNNYICIFLKGLLRYTNKRLNIDYKIWYEFIDVTLDAEGIADAILKLSIK